MPIDPAQAGATETAGDLCHAAGIRTGSHLVGDGLAFLEFIELVVNHTV